MIPKNIICLWYDKDAEAAARELVGVKVTLEPLRPAMREQLQALAAPLAKNGYGQYLLRILDEKVF